ncbi:acyl-coenzyme A thioesterase 13-like [Trichogramma pretiosum]|uniref:acyl-coenzyme A thioesterase 13-like n=1 Tax=Trichogramma pretiosum TaxID=7493 RepID=UPI0006C9459E|nr:acyl-coenzyme A thioesterase 13-like [Trichogramma pretiosum]
MSKVAQFIRTVFDATKNSNCYGRCLKKVELISVEDGKCKAELKVDEEHLNYGGTLHGGFTSTLVDCISTYALMSHKAAVPGVSVDLHVTFLKAAFPGDVISIDARTIKAGRTLAFLEVEITKKDCGSIVARGVHTKFIGGSSS